MRQRDLPIVSSKSMVRSWSKSMVRSWWRATVLAVCALALVDCAPVYRTTYQYSPPKTAQGKACLEQCDIVYDQCQALEQKEQESCELQAETEHEQCEREARRAYRRCKKREGTSCRENGCSRSHCSDPDYDCLARYNHCYETGCGGQVLSTTRCVSNCPKDKS